MKKKATSSKSLAAQVRAICQRLTNQGWDTLLLSHGLDLNADDLEAELAKQLPAIDRRRPGFEDFARSGCRGIEPGRPELSLLYHALASPLVHPEGERTSDRYPTLEELDTVENYVYAAARRSVHDMRVLAGGAPLALVVFAREYRPAAGTVHGKYADMCYSRIGVARVGTREARYLHAERGFTPFSEESNAISVQPCRYGTYLAALLSGSKEGHGPLEFIPVGGDPLLRNPEHSKDAGVVVPDGANSQEPGDAARLFWIPLHRLFDGQECLVGEDVHLEYTVTHRNEKLRKVHLRFQKFGFDGRVPTAELNKPPYILTEHLAETKEGEGGIQVTPVVHEHLVEEARTATGPATFQVPEAVTNGYFDVYRSTLEIAAVRDEFRLAPEYVHGRHRIHDDGTEENLNDRPHLSEVVAKGRYRAKHYLDFTADGTVRVTCRGLSNAIPRSFAAYSIVACPDFFPLVDQTALVSWWKQSCPPELVANIWPGTPGVPLSLASQRLPANVELDSARFGEKDDTMPAIVGHFGSGQGELTHVREYNAERASSLPDGLAGVFAPGWDTSLSAPASAEEIPTIKTQYLANYGLGSPFPEDAKLCAALSAFWPAASPDTARTFEPHLRYASTTPLPDRVIGFGGKKGWDGVVGPKLDLKARTVIYTSLSYADYVEAALKDEFQFEQIGRTTTWDYINRTVSMARVYQVLGATTTSDKVKWVLVSFTAIDEGDAELKDAERQTGLKTPISRDGGYRFLLLHSEDENWVVMTGKPKFHQTTVKFGVVHTAYSDVHATLLRRGDEPWRAFDHHA